MTHSATLLILDALAVARLTRIITVDTILAGLRQKLYGSRPAQSRDLTGERIQVVARPRLAELLSCPWCVSPYIAIGVLLLQALAAPVCLYVSAILAFSQVAGMLAERG